MFRSVDLWFVVFIFGCGVFVLVVQRRFVVGDVVVLPTTPNVTEIDPDLGFTRWLASMSKNQLVPADPMLIW